MLYTSRIRAAELLRGKIATKALKFLSDPLVAFHGRILATESTVQRRLTCPSPANGVARPRPTRRWNAILPAFSERIRGNPKVGAGRVLTVVDLDSHPLARYCNTSRRRDAREAR